MPDQCVTEVGMQQATPFDYVTAALKITLRERKPYTFRNTYSEGWKQVNYPHSWDAKDFRYNFWTSFPLTPVSRPRMDEGLGLLPRTSRPFDAVAKTPHRR
ncbi:hypothetical protein SKAU_G00143780 [Synaphobranchus kaupii]|uniref:Uncharacterized protein n=1 Tax=Synaphobranchus kaupii TaxID=118154 RepID=A0A9Q1FTT2_SYNKA|nr:hypothetical protein SKAU_G00143780 [Synaphobranchus kaupii]